MKAERLPDGQIKLGGEIWFETFEPDELEGRIDLYKRLLDKTGREDDRATVAALEAER